MRFGILILLCAFLLSNAAQAGILDFLSVKESKTEDASSPGNEQISTMVKFFDIQSKNPGKTIPELIRRGLVDAKLISSGANVFESNTISASDIDAIKEVGVTSKGYLGVSCQQIDSSSIKPSINILKHTGLHGSNNLYNPEQAVTRIRFMHCSVVIVRWSNPTVPVLYEDIPSFDVWINDPLNKEVLLTQGIERMIDTFSHSTREGKAFGIELRLLPGMWAVSGLVNDDGTLKTSVDDIGDIPARISDLTSISSPW